MKKNICKGNFLDSIHPNLFKGVCKLTNIICCVITIITVVHKNKQISNTCKYTTIVCVCIYIKQIFYHTFREGECSPSSRKLPESLPAGFL